MSAEGVPVPEIEGDRVYLREIRVTDVHGSYQRWMRDPTVTRYLEMRFHPSGGDALLEYVDSMRASSANVLLAIVEKSDDQHIGNIKVGPINPFHRTADVGLLIGERSYRGRGFGTEAIKLVIDYAWSTLDLHKLNASCYETNLASARAFERNGFVREGIRRA